MSIVSFHTSLVALQSQLPRRTCVCSYSNRPPRVLPPGLFGVHKIGACRIRNTETTFTPRIMGKPFSHATTLNAFLMRKRSIRCQSKHQETVEGRRTWRWRGHEVAYLAAGGDDLELPVVLLVHGFGASSGHWRRTIPFLSDNNYRVYAIDLLGFGKSAKPLIDYTMELWEQQIIDFLKEHAPHQPVLLIGNSVGSLACLMVAATNSTNQKSDTEIAGLVLMNCAGGMNNKAIVDDWRLKLVYPLFLLIDWLLRQPTIARYLFDAVRNPENLRQVLRSLYPSNADAVDDELVQLLYSPSSDVGALETFVSVITGPPGPRPEELIPKIHSPLLLLWGTADTFTPSDGPVGKFFQNLPSQRSKTVFHHLNGVGHCPMDEAPDTVHQLLGPWLAENFPFSSVEEKGTART